MLKLNKNRGIFRFYAFMACFWDNGLNCCVFYKNLW